MQFEASPGPSLSALQNSLRPRYKLVHCPKTSANPRKLYGLLKAAENFKFAFSALYKAVVRINSVRTPKLNRLGDNLSSSRKSFQPCRGHLLGLKPAGGSLYFLG